MRFFDIINLIQGRRVHGSERNVRHSIRFIIQQPNMFYVVNVELVFCCMKVKKVLFSMYYILNCSGTRNTTVCTSEVCINQINVCYIEKYVTARKLQDNSN